MEFRTSDLNLAAFLKAKYNFKIRNLEPDQQENDRALFVFLHDDDIDINRYIAEYYNGDDICSINIFMREISDLRSWLRNFRANKA